MEHPYLSDGEGKRYADSDTELADEDSAMVWVFHGRLVTDPASQQAPKSGAAQQQGHLQASSKVRHAQQLEVKGEEHHAAPGYAADNTLQPQAEAELCQMPSQTRQGALESRSSLL